MFTDHLLCVGHTSLGTGDAAMNTAHTVSAVKGLTSGGEMGSDQLND